ncbi:DMT family transporter [Actinomadura opuntiae]|uniref:DMT family transporter n=1 Tax=Actinomadura sp. OS1-43 TaxID=604315 RepID=UPI00255B07BF|nr:DMT family transporter [Actinomadura sp. OS1-43]MDL4814248.1 DMT family transporter [Actinomadura sp. OS1-43]
MNTVPGSGLQPPVIIAVLGSALLHACWNAIAHGIKDQLVAFALIGAGGLLPAIPLLVWAAPPAAACRPYLAVSAVLQIAYSLLLMQSYKVGEFGQVYPLARGTSPLLVAGFATAFVGEHLSLPQMTGVVLIPVGLGSLALVGGRPSRPALLAAVGTGLAIAAYTVVDGFGARLSSSALAYIAWLKLLQGAGVLLAAAASRRGALIGQARRVWRIGLTGGILSAAAYGLVLWAQTRGALAPIAALRETSIIIGAILGTLLFHEPFGRSRITATVFVATGIILLNLP